MLVRFRSDVGDITMFGDIAITLIKMMGHSGTVPSALLAPDIPAALQRLMQAVHVAPSSSAPKRDLGADDNEPPVPLHLRAFPLIELLKRCAKEQCDLLWEQQDPRAMI